jgi:hypothetical protein
VVHPDLANAQSIFQNSAGLALHILGGHHAIQQQAATGLGTFDVDDLILNLLGVFLGYLLYRCFLKCPYGGEV